MESLPPKLKWKRAQTCSTGSNRVHVLVDQRSNMNQIHHAHTVWIRIRCGRLHSRHGGEEVIEGPPKRVETSITLINSHHNLHHLHPPLHHNHCCTCTHLIAATTSSTKRCRFHHLTIFMYRLSFDKQFFYKFISKCKAVFL